MAYNNRGTAHERSHSSRRDNQQNNALAPGGVQSFSSTSAPSSDSGSQTKQPGKGRRWIWDSQYRDYVQKIDGEILRYSEYCAAHLDGQSTSRSGTAQGPAPLDGSFTGISQPENGNQKITQDGESTLEQLESLSLAGDAPPAQSPADEQPTVILKPYETPLDLRFRVVEKPKRFFAIGRIFKTVWFEPGTQQDPSTANPDVDWSAACPPFHQEKPFAKFRWFVVVRKRLHHSLCFTITTFGGKGATKTSRGRARDFVVLYPHGIEPPEPWPEEGIERDPLAVIIEEGQQFLSPAARVDCGRIYTVEDNLRVMKIGRIHPESLGNLEECYRESV
ncbi:hypothetical protein CONLIGDRAFT_630568, partial [Coniochaeta ligniaria NRRL 30616]